MSRKTRDEEPVDGNAVPETEVQPVGPGAIPTGYVMHPDQSGGGRGAGTFTEVENERIRICTPEQAAAWTADTK